MIINLFFKKDKMLQSFFVAVFLAGFMYKKIILSNFIRCTQCVSSPFPCDWCVGGHRCTHDTGENCRNDILVTGISVSS